MSVAPTRDRLVQLVRSEDRPWLSLLMPTHRRGAEVQQDPTRLKNLLREARERLAGHGLNGHDADAFLAPLDRLLDDTMFWLHQDRGLAIYRSPSRCELFRIPVAPDETAVLAPRPLVRPLVPALAWEGTFHVLALSLRRVRLVRADAAGAQEIALRDVPTSLEQALGPPERERDHGGAGGAAPRGTTQRDSVLEDRDVVQFFQLVDRGVARHVVPKDSPVVLAGVQKHVATYRRITDLHVLDGAITGSPDELSADELRERALEVAGDELARVLSPAARRLDALERGERLVATLPEVLRAAAAGRVEALFVDADAERWGRFDRTTGSIELHAERRDDDEELVDAAVRETLARGGDVMAVDPARLPGGADGLAAVLRY
ncbi:MAG: hypothetical protein D6738_09850 [Acidobacteria bacterium]|nr:MAG: hypothetical protein D6738_09850 [Acidobacteriota bacterium]